MGESSDHNYTTALSHAVLAGTSIFCLLQHPKCVGSVCFGLMATNSFLGLWRWGNPEAGSVAKKAYEITGKCQESLVLGAVASEIWLSSNILPSLWFMEIVIPAIPLICHFIDQDLGGDVGKGVIIFNGVSIAYVSIVSGNWWALAAAASFLWGYFWVKDQGSIRDIPAIDLINYELCFFSIFAMKALVGHCHCH